MKKSHVQVLLCLAFVFLLVYASCAKEPPVQNETSSPGTSASTTSAGTTSVNQTEQAATEPRAEQYVQFTPEGYLPYPVTTAVSAKDQEAIDWMRNYLQKNKSSFDLVAGEVLGLDNRTWSIGNHSGDGFVPNYQVVPNREWEALSTSAQQALEMMAADFHEKFAQDGDIEFGIGAVGHPREDGRRAVHFNWTIFGDDWEELARHLAYFPEGYANIRPDTPYIDFGDGWHFYCGVNL